MRPLWTLEEMGLDYARPARHMREYLQVLQPLLQQAALPGGITTEATRAEIEATFSVKGPETLHSRFDLRFPSLTVMRNDLKLDLDTALISGSADYADKRLAVEERHPSYPTPAKRNSR